MTKAPATPPAVPWPWAGDVGAHRPAGDAIATRHPDGTVTLTWEPNDARSTIVSRDVLNGIVDERNRLTEALNDALAGQPTIAPAPEQMVEMTDRTIELITSRDSAEIERLRAELAEVTEQRDAVQKVALDYARERDEAGAEIERTRRERDDALAEVDRLRGQIDEARRAYGVKRTAELRREAGLS